NEDPFGNVPAAAPPARPAETVVRGVVEQEKIHRLIEALKTPEQPAAARELVLRGQAALPALLEALERRGCGVGRAGVEAAARPGGPAGAPGGAGAAGLRDAAAGLRGDPADTQPRGELRPVRPRVAAAAPDPALAGAHRPQGGLNRRAGSDDARYWPAFLFF